MGMRNIETILSELGIDIPDEKKEDLRKAVSENYKTIAEHNKVVGKLETERDNWKSQADTSAETLKSFEGIDPGKISDELASWKKKAEDAEKDFNAKIYERDFADALKAGMAKYKFTSQAAEKAVMEEVKAAGLKMTGGKIYGLEDCVNDIRSRDKSAFVDDAQQQANANKAKFTEPNGSQGGGSANTTLTREQILAIKDPSERQRTIAQNIGLFRKG